MLAATATLLSGCLVLTVAGAAGAVVGTAVGVTGKAVVMTAKGAGAVMGAVLPGGGKKKDAGG